MSLKVTANTTYNKHNFFEKMMPNVTDSVKADVIISGDKQPCSNEKTTLSLTQMTLDQRFGAKTHFLAPFCKILHQISCDFSFFSFLAHKTLKKHISNSV